MPRNISFALTTQQFKDRTKTVTRRMNWLNLKIGDELTGCVKCMGLNPGEKIERLGTILVVGVRREPLNRMILDAEYGAREAKSEGFPGMSGAEFVSMFCSHMKCKPSNCFHLSGMNQKEPIMHPDDEDMNNDYAAGGCICAGAVGIVFLIFVASIIGVFLVIERVLNC